MKMPPASFEENYMGYFTTDRVFCWDSLELNSGHIAEIESYIHKAHIHKESEAPCVTWEKCQLLLYTVALLRQITFTSWTHMNSTVMSWLWVGNSEVSLSPSFRGSSDTCRVSCCLPTSFTLFSVISSRHFCVSSAELSSHTDLHSICGQLGWMRQMFLGYLH